MPELPEVETIARGLAKRITGDAIDSVWLGEKRDLLKSPPAEIAETLEHSRIVAIGRIGKHIVFNLEKDDSQKDGPKKNAAVRGLPPAKSRLPKRKPEKSASPAQTGKAQFIVHLGMTGRLQVCDPQTEIEKHSHAILRLASGRELRFVDPRRFGRLSVAPTADFNAGGIEPLEIDLDRFVPLFRGRKTPIKSALLNQKLLRGVGNIYADESLFRAGIRPRRRASSITTEQLAKLLVAIQEVLKEAIALGGSSVSDYVDADGAEGFFQLQHRVYGREAEPCLVCKTPIKRVVVAGRSSHYCPKCQK
jgi:formamidopyrimidine-DNA glycosylase